MSTHSSRRTRLSPRPFRLTATRISLPIVIALGVGANLAILSILYGVFIGPRPFTRANDLVVVENRGAYRLARLDTAVDVPTLSWPDYLDLKTFSRSFAALGALASPEKVTWQPGDRTRWVWRLFVTDDLLRLTGARPVAGRLLDARDFAPGAPSVALVTTALWRRQLGSDPRVVGRAIHVDGRPLTLVGVVADEVVTFLRERKELFDESETDGRLIVPLVAAAAGRGAVLLERRRENRGSPFLTVVGRRRAEISLPAAQDEVRTISLRLAQAYPETNQGREMAAVAWSEWRTRTVAYLIPMLVAVAVFALLVACLSGLGLILADAVRRAPEMAIRRALGASPARLTRLVLLRVAWWTLPGGGLALGFAWFAVRLVDVTGGAASPPLHMPFGLGVIGVAAGFTALGGLALGLAAAWVLRRQDLTAGLQEAGQATSTGRSRRFALGVLLAMQVFAATSLGLVSGLLIHSMVNVVRVDLGFAPERSFVVPVSLPADVYQSRDQQLEFLDGALERVRRVPGVVAAGLSDVPPLTKGAITVGGASKGDIALEAAGQLPLALNYLIVQHVSPGYFEALGMKMSRGRAFTDSDYRSNAPVVIVGEAFCREHMGTADPLQAGIRLGVPLLSIVGVVKDVRQSGPISAPWNTVYLLQTRKSRLQTTHVVVKAAGPTSDVVRDVVAELAARDVRVCVDEGQLLATLLKGTLAARSRTLRLLMMTAAVVLLLTAFSLSGALGQFVESQTRQIAVRTALGATWRHTLSLFVGYLGVPCGIGLVLGCFGGWLLARMLSCQLFGLTAADPVTTAGAVAAVLMSALIAAVAPFWRARRLDLVSVLRG